MDLTVESPKMMAFRSFGFVVDRNVQVFFAKINTTPIDSNIEALYFLYFSQS